MPLWNPDRTVAQLAPRWAAAPSAFVELDGMRVHVRDERGSSAATPIVLIHGVAALAAFVAASAS